jgi:flagellar biosynthesis/type III secretory pathway protein FliH
MELATTGSTDSRLVGLRLRARAPGSPAAALLDLRQREQDRLAEAAAVRDVCAAARQAVAALPATVADRVEELAGVATELGLALARELVGAALEKGLVDPTPVVLRCLRDCVHGAGKADLVVRLNPQDLAAVQERLRDNAELRQEIADARFVADPVVPRGGVRAETGAGRLLYDPQEVLARICAEVRREVSS